MSRPLEAAPSGSYLPRLSNPSTHHYRDNSRLVPEVVAGHERQPEALIVARQTHPVGDRVEQAYLSDDVLAIRCPRGRHEVPVRLAGGHAVVRKYWPIYHAHERIRS